MGRPSSFTQETADAICRRISDGESLRQVCRDEGMPDKVTVLRWLDAHEAFRTQYARAREALMDHFADEILEIADDSTNDWIERENRAGGTYQAVDVEAIQRAKLRVESRQWLMAKCAPKKYGDKQQINATVDGTINVVTGVPRAG